MKNVNASLYIEGKEIYEGFGEMLFTHFGVSGPLILSASSYYQNGGGKAEKEERKAGRKNRKTAKHGERSACAPEAGFKACAFRRTAG